MGTRTPIHTAELFPEVHAELIGLLRGLDDDDWARPTLAAPWRVRDVVAHLLDGDLRKLSGDRDGQQMTTRTVSSFADIVDLVNEINAGGVKHELAAQARRGDGSIVSRDIAENMSGSGRSGFRTDPHAG